MKDGKCFLKDMRQQAGVFIIRKRLETRDLVLDGLNSRNSKTLLIESRAGGMGCRVCESSRESSQRVVIVSVPIGSMIR